VTARVWGQDPAALPEAADVASLGRLERELLGGLGLPDRPRRDAHVHLGRDSDGHGLTVDELLADMDACGIASAVCFPANDPGEDGRFTRANDLVAAAAARAPGRIVPFCRVDPGSDWRGAMERAAERGARGLKLHPVAQRFRPEAPECLAAVAAATEQGWPVLLHAGFGARRLAGPMRELARAVPSARLILAHGGRGDAAALADAFAGDPRVAFDTSLASLVDLAGLPPEQLMLGSDRPYGEHAGALHLVARAAEVAGWSKDQLAGVLGGNLERWLA
jgi:predicted TIM-barrel fold metal-dependent hydrolase